MLIGGVAALALTLITPGERVFGASPTSPANAVDFDRQVRPILSDNCFTCHGPDDSQRQAKLRLDTKDGMFADRGGYQVIVPGDSANSRLFQRISHKEEIARMPPPGSERKLTPQQIETIRQWIEQGAAWESHWAYIPPKRPELPAVSAVDGKTWPRNAIDNFVLARLQKEGLEPSPETDKRTLIRRVSLDLTGLPPTPAEVDAFLNDSSPDAYEKVVDRLLKSPHYGERMAIQWLDLARYADTHGYHIDSYREMWPWRDWVISAFNRDLPFDKFVLWQLAGDLLPNPTREQRLATAFNRNHMINFEGGAIPEEYQTEYVVDRVETTSNVFMGMTLGCARCHDHKYDPIKQEEFYRFFAFFNHVPEKGLDGVAGNAAPVMELPSSDQEARMKELKQAITDRQHALPDFELGKLQLAWEEKALDTIPAPPTEGLLAHYELDGSVSDTSGHYHHGSVNGKISYSEGRVGRSASFGDESKGVDLGPIGAFERGDAFSLAFWLRVNGTSEGALIRKATADKEARGYALIADEVVPFPEKLKRGYHLRFRMAHQWPDNALEIQTRERLIQRDWYHVALTYDGSGKAAGVRLWIDGKPRAIEMTKDALTGGIGNEQLLEMARSVGEPFGGQIDDLRIYTRALPAAEIEQLAVDEPIRAVLAATEARGAAPPIQARSCEQEEQLHAYYMEHVVPQPYRETFAELEKLQTERSELEKSLPTVMVMEEMKEPRDTFILGRGDYRNQGEKVTPGVPAVLPPLPPGAPPNRLGLAEWLLDPGNPLTARVAVNRFWQMFFGTGIVRTSEDFGSQGEAPTHPELLDWLATEFMRNGWNIQAIQRLIVTSATYRQSSRVTPELLERDPENRLLARMSRFRLPAEVVRDNALAISGLLTDKIGGRSVYPYQPKGLWEEMAYGDVHTAQHYLPSHGEDLYRRSLYTVWKRTVPPASLSTFDAPDREKCTVRRPRTNTPLQALVLLNDPTYIEAARVLAERMIEQGGKTPAARVRRGYLLALAREPAPAETDVLLTIAARQAEEFQAHPEEVRELLTVGERPYDEKLDPAELAAWTTVASTILNLDEAITKE
jgi:mono/diheme cytochrome c family protein